MILYREVIEVGMTCVSIMPLVELAHWKLYIRVLYEYIIIPYTRFV